MGWVEKQAETAAAEEKPKSGRTEGDARTYADNAICLEHCFYTHFTQGTYYMGTKVQITKKKHLIRSILNVHQSY